MASMGVATMGVGGRRHKFFWCGTRRPRNCVGPPIVVRPPLLKKKVLACVVAHICADAQAVSFDEMIKHYHAAANL